MPPFGQAEKQWAEIGLFLGALGRGRLGRYSGPLANAGEARWLLWPDAFRFGAARKQL
jgi:hypothetical protein